ncbi:MAG: alpha/beta fold hydrolase [Spirosomataceae bacterium]
MQTAPQPVSKNLSTGPKWLRTTGKVVLVVFVILNILLALHAWHFTYFYEANEAPFKRPEELSTWEKTRGALFGMRFSKRVIDTFPAQPFQTVKVTTQDGITLEGWQTQADSTKGTVILWHGHGSAKSRILCEIALFRSFGYNTLSFDFRAHGNSSGNVCTIGYAESEDIRAVFDYAQKQSKQPIILFGTSMGAASVMKAVAEYQLQPQKIILSCPFGSMLDAVRGRLRTMHIPAAGLSELLICWGSIERGMWAFGHQPTEYAKGIHSPVLLTWGALDKRVLQNETDAIFANLASAQKKLVIFEQSGHESYCTKEPAKWQQTVRDFLTTSK